TRFSRDWSSDVCSSDLRRADRAERVADLHSDLAGGCRVGAGGPASPAAPAARAAAPGRATAGLAPGGKPILTYTAWREQFCCQRQRPIRALAGSPATSRPPRTGGQYAVNRADSLYPL